MATCELLGPRTEPLVVAVDMGYGHMRAADALAHALGTVVLPGDRPPLADAAEVAVWSRMRRAYERISRLSQLPLAGRPLRAVLDGMTEIPRLYPYRDQSSATFAVRSLERLTRGGVGRTLAAHLAATGQTLLTTFYATAIAAERHGARRILCVVTDTDINRVWAPRAADATAIEYCVPSERALRRLRAYGVPRARIHVTGFPLPPTLTGGDDLSVLRTNLARRLARLDPAGAFRGQFGDELRHFFGPLPEPGPAAPPHLVFAVGGAGAQAQIAREMLDSLAEPIRAGRIRLTLVAGVRTEVAERFAKWLGTLDLLGAGSGVDVLVADTLDAYFERFNAVLADADILWTKPSELTFYAALGLPLVFAPPLGVHERLNRRWAIQRGAGLKQDVPKFAWQWLQEWLAEGTLAAAAWSGYMRLPKFGTPRILEVARQVSARASS